MSYKIIPAMLAILALSAVTLTFQNCGPQGVLEQPGAVDQSSVTELVIDDPIVAFDQRNDMKVMTSDQVYRSMSSLTGVDLGNTIAQNDWRNNRTNTLADNFSLNAITPPLLLNLTNLAGIFCDESLKVETVATATRRLFVGVNFAEPVSALSGPAFGSFVQNLSQVLWGRTITAAEQTMLEQARSNHDNAIVAAQRANVAETRRLALMVCTAMLSSNDSFTF